MVENASVKIEKNEPIEVDSQLISALLREEASRVGRPLTSIQEREELVSRFVRDEALFREAMHLGLDQGDVIVRRRLIQKMEFLLQNGIEIEEPSDEELRREYDSQSSRFVHPPKRAFTHIFFSKENHRDAEQKARQVLTLLHEEPRLRASHTGDPFLEGYDFPLQTKSRIENRFGSSFADAVFHASREWTGPVESSFGFHLIRITDQRDERPFLFDEARRHLLREWREQKREQLTREAVETLIARYPLIIEE